MTPTRFDDLSSLTDPGSLARLLGPVRSVNRKPLGATGGFSSARLERLEITLADGAARSLVLKTNHPARDWIGRLSGDTRGREVLMLEEPALQGVWGVFACSYLAWARTGDEFGLLMEDLSPHLLPDVREPIGAGVEARLLGALARLHARYWNAPPDGLASYDDMAGIVAPGVADRLLEEHPDNPLFRRMAEGWRIAESRLSGAAWRLLLDQRAVFAARARGLGVTLNHGDSKVGNFAPLPDGRVAAFDWAMVMSAPIAVELGWYLAVNATRLAGSRGDALSRYREALESALGRTIAAEEWESTVSLANFCSAVLMLWSKAHGAAAGDPLATGQWDWYSEELDRLASEWGA